jgi:Flp pilus assembly pilin Flp
MITAINVLVARGWPPSRALAYVALLARMGHHDILARLARDESGEAAEYAVQVAAVAVSMIALFGMTDLAVDAAWRQAQVGLTDTTPVHLCAGPVHQSPTGGSC